MNELEGKVAPPRARIELFRSTPIDGQMLKQLVEKGLFWLRTNQQTVNALNVYPVPDGDTGTNMVLTMQSALEEVASLPDHNVGKIAHAVAHGALMGARGNSGVILSQLWRGFARALDDQPILDGHSLVHAFEEGRDTAYKGVVRPVEGTILTVAKDIATAAKEALEETIDPIDILEKAVSAADVSVQRTPELLEVHKKAGVVDAGGKGLFFILEGMLRYIQGLPLEAPVTMVRPLNTMVLEEAMEVIEPGQDIEFVVDFRPNEPFNLENFYAELEKMGTSIQIGEGDGLYRMHIHVSKENRHKPVEYVESLGTWYKYTTENLQIQMEGMGRKTSSRQPALYEVEAGQIAVVVVSPGRGIAQVFASLNAAAIVEGGQTMNPSTAEIFQACERLGTDKIIILPNNKNVVLAAKSAAELISKLPSERVAVVVPSHSVPQGLAAMLRYAPDGEFEMTVREMNAGLADAQTGEITQATRSAEVDGVYAQEGQYIALLNDRLVEAAETLEEALLGLLVKVGAEDYGLVTLFYGANMSKEGANTIARLIRDRYPNLEDVEVKDGGQPHYHFIVSIE